MRALLVLGALATSAPTVAAPSESSSNNAAANCPRTSMHVADQIGAYRGKGLVPQKLTQLPPAVTYMAVYRQIGGCEAPLTLSDYRRAKRR
jgi:hypothetical protein